MAIATSNKNKNSSGRSLPEHEWFIVMAGVIMCLAFGPPQAGAGTAWLQKDKLTASDGAEGDQFGRSVSISGDYAIVGAYRDDDRGTDSGSAYIFKRYGTVWSQQQKLLAPDGAASDWFGRSVSISGDYAIIGATYGDGNVPNSGSAYIFEREGAAWLLQAKLLAADGAAGDCFGCSVSISGDYAIVGTLWDDGRGSAYIFRWDGAGWSQQQKLTDSDGAAGDSFGCSVSISGDGNYAIIGAKYDDDKGDSSGSAYIFKREGSAWSQQQKLTDSDGAAGDSFGCSVSISGDKTVVGAEQYLSDGTGKAYIFKWDGNSWVQQQKLLASDGAPGDFFGCSVSISGDYAIIGAIYGDGSGSAYIFIFRWDGTGWVQQRKLTASDGAAIDWFGYSVSIRGDYAIIGAIYDDDRGTDSGSAYIFNPCAGWLTADLNSDCFVDFADFSVFVNQWLKCGDPADPNCQP